MLELFVIGVSIYIDVVIADKNLEVKCLSPFERVGIKSGIWDTCGVFLYNTATHIRYLLISGDTGTVKAIETTIYMSGIIINSIQAILRTGDVTNIDIDDTEYKFKLALHNKRYNEV